MLDLNTFLTTLYVTIDGFCKEQFKPNRRHGPVPSLSVSEMLTLAIYGQWRSFASERDFYRFADAHLRPYFPTLPAYSQFNRLMRLYEPELVHFFRHTVEMARCPDDLYEVIDGFGVATRNCHRHGDGWLPLAANKGICSRLGWFVGFQVMDCVTSEGAITGFGFSPASVKDVRLAETMLALRAEPDPRAASVGEYTDRPYVADKGFAGEHWQYRIQVEYGACVLSAPRTCDSEQWPRWIHRLHASLREIVETVHGKLLNTFRLCTERPHTLDGFRTRLTAKIALHNFCIWLNKQAGRPPLAFADLLG